MKPQVTYFLYGYYGAGNFGDDILLRAAIEGILRVDPKAQFLVRNHGPVPGLGDLESRVTLTDIEKIHRRPVPAPVKFFLFLKTYWHWMGRASHLVVGGGTLIHDAPYLKATFLLLCLTIIARLRGCKVYGIGLGVKRIETRQGQMIVRTLIRCFHRLCLRDQDSMNRCRGLLPNAKHLVLTSDLAYALDWPVAESGNIIGVTLVNYMFENEINRDLIATLAQALSVFISRGHEIRLIVLQKHSYAGGGDETILQQVLENIPKQQHTKCRMVFPEATQADVHAAFQGLGLMLGMRFHGLVFSAMNKIPFAGLAHEPKIDAIAREFNMPFLPLSQIDAVSLTRIMEEAMTHKIDETKITGDRDTARNNFIFRAEGIKG